MFAHGSMQLIGFQFVFLFAKEFSSSNKSIRSSTCSNTILKYKYKFKHTAQALRHEHLASRGKNSKSVLMHERLFGLRFATSWWALSWNRWYEKLSSIVMGIKLCAFSCCRATSWSSTNSMRSSGGRRWGFTPLLPSLRIRLMRPWSSGGSISR